ncbi:hypothetical protein OYT13_16615 [Pandoraea sp. XJJ-1]|uniref:hypothetical protein n=1 Tax=Pandoraea sp. XJJ-1 TaxID=3002643 RepID=UPI002281EDFE|nr:hypothetical protein [Pandoraea sp. XJJ-1]WAL81462.1 hypothetical protein OYT13_16615 [Pandoraea sp. XJJ-1]
MNIKQKIVVYLGLVLLLIAVLALWAVFAYNGKTDVGAFIAQIGGLVTIIIAAISAVGGFHSAQSGGSALLAGVSLLPSNDTAAVPSAGTNAAPDPVTPPVGSSQ